MAKSLLVAAALLLGVALGVIITRAAAKRTPPNPPTLVTSLAVGDPAVAALVAARVAVIDWPSADGTVTRYALVGGPSMNRTLTLVGRAPTELPDDHGVATLAAVDVAGGTATVAYLSRFDHAAFGKELTTVECRVVTVRVKPAGRAGLGEK